MFSHFTNCFAASLHVLIHFVQLLQQPVPLPVPALYSAADLLIYQGQSVDFRVNLVHLDGLVIL